VPFDRCTTAGVVDAGTIDGVGGPAGLLPGLSRRASILARIVLRELLAGKAMTASKLSVWWGITFGTLTDGFLGAIVVCAPDMRAAVAKTRDLGQHPGGLELGIPFRASGFDPAYVDRLLSREEFRELPRPVGIVEAWEAAARSGPIIDVNYNGDTMHGYALPEDEPQDVEKLLEQAADRNRAALDRLSQ